MKNKLFISSLAITMVIFISSPAFCATVARYNSPPHGIDFASAIATDASGNVYVTGTSIDESNNRDYATAAYDATGKRLWVKSYDGSANELNGAKAIITDISGNVYVTGSIQNSDTGLDYTTIAYDSSGNQLWVKIYNGPTNGDDWVNAITTDAAGNIYVTGVSNGASGTSGDYTTIAYDSSGNQLWVARYNGPANGHDYAAAIATDSSGNIYVTGGSPSSDTESGDYATVAYDSRGNQLWARRYNGPLNGSDGATAIATDSSGNVYVTGNSHGSGTGLDYATIAYDTDGNELWVARYNGPDINDDLATAIITDATGNVYVTGSSYGNDTDTDYATVAYDASGNELWVQRYNGPTNAADGAKAIATDSFGHIYVTGDSLIIRGDGSGYATVAYDASGNELWVTRYMGWPHSFNIASAIATDTSGHIYVTGWSDGGWATDWDYGTVAYDSSGTQLWVQRYNGPTNDFTKDIATDSSGKVYVTGASGTIAYDSNLKRLWLKSDDYARGRAIVTDSSRNIYVIGNDNKICSYSFFIAAYNSRGTPLWISLYCNSFMIVTAIAADSSGNVYVTGFSQFPYSWNRSSDYITVAYNSSGTQLWRREYSNPAGGDEVGHDRAAAIATDSSGNVYVTGYSIRSKQFRDRDYATVAYDSSGNQLWIRRYNGPRNSHDGATAISIDSSGNIYVTGVSYGGSATNYDYATVAYNSRGNQLWVKRYNGPKNAYDGANAIATDSSGRLYVTGRSYGGSGLGYDYATVAYNARGKQLWVRRYNGPRNRYDEAHAIVVDSAGRVYVTGQSLGSGTGADYATIAYNSSGKQLWVKRYNGPANGADIPQAMAIGLSGHVYVTGQSLGNDTGYDYATVKY